LAAISPGGENATLEAAGLVLDFAPVRMEKEMAVAAAHQPKAELRQAHSAVAQVMLLPAAIRHTVGTEERLGDIAVAGMVEATVQRPQREQQASAAVRRQCGRIEPKPPTAQSPREPHGRNEPDLKQGVERQQDGGEFCPIRPLVGKSKRPRVDAEHAFSAVHSERIPETAEVEAPDEAAQLRRKVDERDDRRERRRRPKHAARVGVAVGLPREIATPNAARRRRRR